MKPPLLRSHFSDPVTAALCKGVQARRLRASPGLTCQRPARPGLRRWCAGLSLLLAAARGTSRAGCCTREEGEPQRRPAASGSAGSSSRLTHGASLALPGSPDASRRMGTEAADTGQPLLHWRGFLGACLLIFWKYLCTRAFFVYTSSLKWSTLFGPFLLLFHIQSTIALFILSEKLLPQIFISGFVFGGSRKCHLCLFLSSPTLCVCVLIHFP